MTDTPVCLYLHPVSGFWSLKYARTGIDLLPNLQTDKMYWKLLQDERLGIQMRPRKQHRWQELLIAEGHRAKLTLWVKAYTADSFSKMLAKATEQRSPNTTHINACWCSVKRWLRFGQQHKLSFFLPYTAFSIPILTSHQMKHLIVNQNRHNSNLVYWLRSQKRPGNVALFYFIWDQSQTLVWTWHW